MLGTLICALIVFGIFASKEERSRQRPPSPQEIAVKKAESDSFDARIYAKLHVEKNLKAPSSAIWPSPLDFAAAPKKDDKGNTIKDVWEVSGYVDSQNSFGAMLRQQWYVKMKKNNDSWSLLDIKFF